MWKSPSEFGGSSYWSDQRDIETAGPRGHEFGIAVLINTVENVLHYERV